MVRRTVPITIQVPVEAAEILVEHGPAIIEAISGLVRQARSQQIDIAPPEVREKRSSKRRQYVASLGRKANRRVRIELAKTSDRKLPPKTRLHEERKIIAALAHELREDPVLIDLAQKSFRRKFRRRIRRCRNRKIHALYLAGRSNNQIAIELGISVSTVARDIAKARKAAQAKDPEGKQ